MGIWFRKDKTKKWHLACYGGSLAECGRDVHVAACYAKERMNLDVDKAGDRNDLCRACINIIMRSRAYMKRLDDEYEERKRQRDGIRDSEDTARAD